MVGKKKRYEEMFHLQKIHQFRLKKKHQIPAHVGPKSPVVTLELIGDLEGQGRAKGQVREGEMNHKDDRCLLGAGVPDEDPQGEDVPHQVDDRDQRVEDRRDDARLLILNKRQGQQGGVVQVAARGVHSHGGPGILTTLVK